MKAALGQIIVRPGFQAALAVLLAVFVGNDHDGQRAQPRVFFHQADHLDAVHARHVHVADDEVVVVRPQRVPAVYAIHRDVHVVAPAGQELAFHFAHRQRVVDHQHALPPPRVRRRRAEAHLAEAAARREQFDRAQQIVHVHDEHRRAVGQDGGGADVLELAQSRVERLDDQLALAEEFPDDDPDPPSRFAEDDHGEFVGRRAWRVELQNLVRRDQTDGLPVKREMLAAFQGFDFPARQPEGPGDPRQGERVRLAADLHEQRAQDRERQRQMQRAAGPASGLGSQPDGAAHLAHHGAHHVQADAAPGKLGDVLARGKTGQEEKLDQLFLAHFGGRFVRGQFLAHDGRAEVFKVDALAVISEDDDEHARAVAGFEGQRALGGLAGALAFLGRFQAVIERVAEQVRQGSLQLFEDVAVHLRPRADEIEAGGLAERPGQVPHETREALRAVGEGAHPAELRLAVKPAREVRGTAHEPFEFLVAARERFGAGRRFPAGFVELGALGLAEGNGRQGRAQIFEEAGEVALPPPGAQQRVGVRRQPAGLHERLARQPEQAIEAVGRDAQDARFGGVGASRIERFCGRDGDFAGRGSHRQQRGAGR